MTSQGVPRHERDSLVEARNSEGQTVAESYRATAATLEAEASTLSRQAAQKRTAAFNYKRMADDWEREHLGREWADLRAGDAFTFRVFDHQEGWRRERREVVAVNGLVFTLRDGEREYDFDASSEPKNRDIRLVSSDG